MDGNDSVIVIPDSPAEPTGVKRKRDDYDDDYEAGPVPKHPLLDSITSRFQQNAAERERKNAIFKSKREMEKVHSDYMKQNVVCPQELAKASYAASYWAKKNGLKQASSRDGRNLGIHRGGFGGGRGGNVQKDKLKTGGCEDSEIKVVRALPNSEEVEKFIQDCLKKYVRLDQETKKAAETELRKKMTPHYCDLCTVLIPNYTHISGHYQGKKHGRKISSFMIKYVKKMENDKNETEEHQAKGRDDEYYRYRNSNLSGHIGSVSSSRGQSRRQGTSATKPRTMKTSTVTSASLESNLDDTSKENNPSASINSLRSKDGELVQSHNSVQSSVAKYICPILYCEAEFSSEGSIGQHMNLFLHSPCNPCRCATDTKLLPDPLCYKCPECDSEFSSKDLCTKHMNEESHLVFYPPLVITAYLCPQCLYLFETFESCWVHMENSRHHRIRFPFKDDETSGDLSLPVAVAEEFAQDYINKCKDIPFQVQCLDCGLDILTPAEFKDHQNETNNLHMMSALTNTVLGDIFCTYIKTFSCDTCYRLFDEQPETDSRHICAGGIVGNIKDDLITTTSDFVKSCALSLTASIKGKQVRNGILNIGNVNRSKKHDPLEILHFQVRDEQEKSADAEESVKRRGKGKHHNQDVSDSPSSRLSASLKVISIQSESDEVTDINIEPKDRVEEINNKKIRIEPVNNVSVENLDEHQHLTRTIKQEHRESNIVQGLDVDKSEGTYEQIENKETSVKKEFPYLNESECTVYVKSEAVEERTSSNGDSETANTGAVNVKIENVEGRTPHYEDSETANTGTVYVKIENVEGRTPSNEDSETVNTGAVYVKIENLEGRTPSNEDSETVNTGAYSVNVKTEKVEERTPSNEDSETANTGAYSVNVKTEKVEERGSSNRNNETINTDAYAVNIKNEKVEERRYNYREGKIENTDEQTVNVKTDKVEERESCNMDRKTENFDPELIKINLLEAQSRDYLKEEPSTSSASITVENNVDIETKVEDSDSDVYMISDSEESVERIIVSDSDSDDVKIVVTCTDSKNEPVKKKKRKKIKEKMMTKKERKRHLKRVAEDTAKRAREKFLKFLSVEEKMKEENPDQRKLPRRQAKAAANERLERRKNKALALIENQASEKQPERAEPIDSKTSKQVKIPGRQIPGRQAKPAADEYLERKKNEALAAFAASQNQASKKQPERGEPMDFKTSKQTNHLPVELLLKNQKESLISTEHLQEMKNIIFLDFDNYPVFFKALPHCPTEHTFVWAFYGGHTVISQKLLNNTFHEMRRKGLVYVSERCGTTKDATDFALVLTVGKMDERLPPNVSFTILSGDKGFCEVERQMRQSKRSAVVINPHNDKDILMTLLKSIAEM